MRIALISDIHGNLVALETVLRDIDALRPDRIVCLGDVAFMGPQPREATQCLMALDCPVVMGNTDEWMLDPGVPEFPTDEQSRRNEDIGFWCLEQLSPTELDFLRTFKPVIREPLNSDTVAAILCFHGSPQDCREVILATTPDDQLEPMIMGHNDLILSGGHTHTQMVRRFRGQMIVNPGSVGLPSERSSTSSRNPPWTEYALVNWQNSVLSVEMRRVPLNINDVVQTAQQSGMPHAAHWAASWH